MSNENFGYPHKNDMFYHPSSGVSVYVHARLNDTEASRYRHVILRRDKMAALKVEIAPNARTILSVRYFKIHFTPLGEIPHKSRTTDLAYFEKQTNLMQPIPTTLFHVPWVYLSVSNV